MELVANGLNISMDSPEVMQEIVQKLQELSRDKNVILSIITYSIVPLQKNSVVMTLPPSRMDIEVHPCQHGFGFWTLFTDWSAIFQRAIMFQYYDAYYSGRRFIESTGDVIFRFMENGTVEAEHYGYRENGAKAVYRYIFRFEDAI